MDGWMDGRTDGWMDGRSLHVLFYSVLHFKTSLSTPINGWANASKEPPGICAQFLSLREVLVNHIASRLQFQWLTLFTACIDSLYVKLMKESHSGMTLYQLPNESNE